MALDELEGHIGVFQPRRHDGRWACGGEGEEVAEVCAREAEGGGASCKVSSRTNGHGGHDTYSTQFRWKGGLCNHPGG